ncbi:cysteine hydrolase [Mycobacterium sp.]|uniref:cysteine hydrolase n=1 Tax=Mycobacterium sp. TaxID=1785 RepID=UPI0011F7C63C|nr:cysteine hydrolase [Mycobacterium sp.]TAM64531.1 MAG: cysteine hydrolase [Mycobacterium sp.]
MTVRGLEPGRRVALIINECQNAMLDLEFQANVELAQQATKRAITKRIAALADACRGAGALVVHSTIVLRRDGLGTTASCLLLGLLVKRGYCVEGKKSAEIHPDLTPRAADYVSQRRHGLTPFHGTELESILRQRGVETVIVTGVSTNVGVPGTCLEAINREFTAVVPEDAVAGSSAEIHGFQIENIIRLLATVTTTDDVLAALPSVAHC